MDINLTNKALRIIAASSSAKAGVMITLSGSDNNPPKHSIKEGPVTAANSGAFLSIHIVKASIPSVAALNSSMFSCPWPAKKSRSGWPHGATPAIEIAPLHWDKVVSIHK